MQERNKKQGFYAFLILKDRCELEIGYLIRNLESNHMFQLQVYCLFFFFLISKNIPHVAFTTVLNLYCPFLQYLYSFF